MTHALPRLGLLATTCAVLLLGSVRAATPDKPAPAPAPAAAEAPKEIVPPTDADKALAARAEAVWETAAGNPGKEAANFLHTGWMHENVRRLAGTAPGTAEQLAWARERVGELVGQAEKGPKWVVPAVVKVPRAAKAPVLSGKLDDPAWAGALRFDGLYKLNFTQLVERPRTSWRVMWDDTNLYFGIDCEDSDISAPVLPVNSNLWEHDCVELFILPDQAKPDYWEIIVSPSNSRFQALHHKLADAWGAVGPTLPEVPGMKVAIQVRAQPAGYSVEFAVPFATLPGYEKRAPAVGQRLWLQMARMDAHPDGKNPDRVDIYDFIPTLSWNHNIWNYAPIELALTKDNAVGDAPPPGKTYTDAVITPVPPAGQPAPGGTTPPAPAPAK